MAGQDPSIVIPIVRSPDQQHDIPQRLVRDADALVLSQIYRIRNSKAGQKAVLLASSASNFDVH